MYIYIYINIYDIYSIYFIFNSLYISIYIYLYLYICIIYMLGIQSEKQIYFILVEALLS